MELLEERVKEVVGLLGFEVEERNLSLIVANHTFDIVVGKVVTDGVSETRGGTLDGNVHRQLEVKKVIIEHYY